MFDDGGVVIENLSCVWFCAPGAGDAFYGEEVFGGVRNAVERTAIVAALDLFFGGLGLRHGNFRSEKRVSVVARTELLAALEKILRELDGRKFLRFDALGKLRDGQKGQFFGGHQWSLGFCRSGWRFSYTGVLKGILFALYERFEIEGRAVAVFEGIGAQAIERGLG